MSLKHRILSIAEHYALDQAAISSGMPIRDLIDHAGRCVADCIKLRWSKRPVLFLCGPGNNGADGLVAAEILRSSGWAVDIIDLSKRDLMANQAMMAAFDRAGIIVDALFGAGLNKPITPENSPIAARLIEQMQQSGKPILAVDVPSGVQGDSGQIMGLAAQAVITITFCRPKQAHYLLPGRDLCGEIIVADIGIGNEILCGDHFTAASQNMPPIFANHPDLWSHKLPRQYADQHKYQRGHVLIRGGAMSGAARLAAQAARHTGAGLVTIACPPDHFAHYTQCPPGVILSQIAEGEWRQALNQSESKRYSALLLGPGNAPDAATIDDVLAALASNKPVLLDAGALCAFTDQPVLLKNAIAARGAWQKSGAPIPVLTPHSGEFQQIVPQSIADESDKLLKTRLAAAWLGAVIIHKGSDSVIAAPDGTAIINHNAPACLATAGAGDVLAGMVAALLSSNMDSFLAAAAGVYRHGKAAGNFKKHSNRNMLAEDISEFYQE